MKKAIRFTANWCQPCRNYEKIWGSVSESRSDWEFVVIDVDLNPEKASEYTVRNIPCTILEDDDNVIFRQTGIISSDDLNDKLNLYL